MDSYGLSRQEATGFSPYRLVFGCDPVVPLPNRRLILDDGLMDYDDEGAMLQALLSKMEALARDMPYALDNLDGAAERDSQRYEQRRTGVYRPSKVHWFREGDLVYTAQRRVNTLQPRAGQGIFRVVQVRPRGILVLQGRNGLTLHRHGKDVALCHLTTVDPRVDPIAAKERYESSNQANTVCEICDERWSAADPYRAYNVLDEMIVCEYCFTGRHIRCLGMTAVPDGDYYCDWCRRYQSG